MTTSGSKTSCYTWCVIIGALIGFIAFLLFMIVGEWAFLASAMIGGLIALIGILAFPAIFCSDAKNSDPHRAGQAPTASSSGGAGASTSSGASSEKLSEKVARAEDKAAEISDTVKAKAASAADAVSETVSTAKTKAASAASSAKDSVSEATSTVKAKASNAASTVSSKASDVMPAGLMSSDDGDAKASAPAAKKKAASTTPKAAAKPAAAKAAKPKAPPVAKDGKPPLLKKARAGGADDLKQIKGVGPGLEKTLNELGFYHFDQIAGWRKKEIEWVDSRLKFKGRIVRDEWTKQCKTLAKGGTTEFSKKVKKGGVY